MRGRSAFLLFVLASVISVAACGSADSGGGSHASGASSGSTAAPTPSISAPPGTVVTGPSTVRMGRFTEIFGTPLPSDPAEVKVAADFREAMVLWDVSQEKRALVPPVTSYVTGAALTTLKTTLTTFNKQNLIPAGTDRLFKTDIVAVTNPAATITSCDDGSKFTEINPVTHAVDPSFVNMSLDDQYAYVTWDMSLRAGHWAFTSIAALSSPVGAAKQCLPVGQ
jgi:hypothetical protein